MLPTSCRRRLLPLLCSGREITSGREIVGIDEWNWNDDSGMDRPSFYMPLLLHSDFTCLPAWPKL
jgi:hypothetical protein